MVTAHEEAHGRGEDGARIDLSRTVAEKFTIEKERDKTGFAPRRLWRSVEVMMQTNHDAALVPPSVPTRGVARKTSDQRIDRLERTLRIKGSDQPGHRRSVALSKARAR
jgi:hypothetical protein